MHKVCNSWVSKHTQPHRTGSLEVWCTTVTKNTQVYSLFHYCKKMCWWGLTQKQPELVLGNLLLPWSQVWNVLRTSPNSPLRGNQGTYKVKAPESKVSRGKKLKKWRKKKLGSLQRELRIVLLYFQCIFPLENIFGTSVLPIKLR